MQLLVPRLQSLVTPHLGFVKPVYIVNIVLCCYPSIEEEKNLSPFFRDPTRMIVLESQGSGVVWSVCVAWEFWHT